jgi:hypothetical protein
VKNLYFTEEVPATSRAGKSVNEEKDSNDPESKAATS